MLKSLIAFSMPHAQSNSGFQLKVVAYFQG